MTNKTIVETAFGYFSEGNVPAILELVTDDIKWTCPGPAEILPYVGVFEGKQGVADFLRLIYENKEYHKFEVMEYIADGNKVVALGYWDASSKRTGKPYSGNWAMTFYFRDGKVYEHSEYYDSFGEAMASK